MLQKVGKSQHRAACYPLAFPLFFALQIFLALLPESSKNPMAKIFIKIHKYEPLFSMQNPKL